MHIITVWFFVIVVCHVTVKRTDGISRINDVLTTFNILLNTTMFNTSPLNTQLSNRIALNNSVFDITVLNAQVVNIYVKHNDV